LLRAQKTFSSSASHSERVGSKNQLIRQGNAEAAAQEKSCGMPVFGSEGDHAASSCKML
jgi:hypothetical protein